MKIYFSKAIKDYFSYIELYADLAAKLQKALETKDFDLVERVIDDIDNKVPKGSVPEEDKPRIDRIRQIVKAKKAKEKKNGIKI